MAAENAGSLDQRMALLDVSEGSSDDEDVVSYTWKLDASAKEKDYSPVFKTKRHSWRILCFPRNNGYLSCYLEFYQERPSLTAACYVQFVLKVVNEDDSKSAAREITHKFTSSSKDWGFPKLAPVSDVQDPSRGFIVDNKITIEVNVEILSDDEDNQAWQMYDSKKATGYVGLRNQGATCYMNSLLQTLFHTPYFRKAIFQLPTEAEENPEKCIPLALQRVFYRLQNDDHGVGTKELTQSFGWDSMESFMQHDIQELNRVLTDNLETKMKGTVVDGAINKMFEGKMVNYIKCTEVDYESSRVESFYDISLNVKGIKNLYESFDKYVEAELLNGENQYQAEGYGKQDAKKGIRFQRFPPVLHLQLKRFEYDFMRDQNIKINDRFEFPAVLELAKYLSEDADRTEDWTYDLHGVLVHSGDVNGGHYYAYVKPGESNEWFKFDDDRVTKAKKKAAIVDNYGLSEPPPNQPGYNGLRRGYRLSRFNTSAYMLVYFRRSDKDWTCDPCTEADVPPHLKARFEEERRAEEQRQKELEEAHLYIKFMVVTDQDIKEHMTTDLVNFERARIFKVKKEWTLNQFMEHTAAEYGVPAHRQRFWRWISRQNKTCRPDMPVPRSQYNSPLSAIFTRPAETVKLWLEVSPNEAAGPDATDEELFGDSCTDPARINLFFKHFDPVNSTNSYVGKASCLKTWNLGQVLPIMRTLAGYPEDKDLHVLEEIRPGMIEPIKPTVTLTAAELQNGDILCFQEVLPPAVLDSCEIKDIKSFYDYLESRKVLRFKRLADPREDGIEIELSIKMDYDTVCKHLAEKVNHPWAKIRLTGHHLQHNGPKTVPLVRTKRDSKQQTVHDFFHHQTEPILYYELLDTTLVEIESKLNLSFHFYNSKVEEESHHTLLVSKTAKVRTVLEELRPLLKLSPDGTGVLRLLSTNYGRLKVHDLDETVDPLGYSELRVEEVLEEEMVYSKHDHLVICAHFHKDPSRPFGSPFLLLVKKGETMGSVKKRVQERLGVADEELAKWKFSVVSMGNALYMEDDEVVATLLESKPGSPYLGLDHVDTTPPSKRKTHATRTHTERSIKIYN